VSDFNERVYYDSNRCFARPVGGTASPRYSGGHKNDTTKARLMTRMKFQKRSCAVLAQENNDASWCLFQECMKKEPSLDEVDRLIHECHRTHSDINQAFDQYDGRAMVLTSLHAACMHHHIDIVNKMLDTTLDINQDKNTAVDVNVVDSAGDTPLYYACGNTALLRRLLQHPDVQVNDPIGGTRGTVLHVACSYEPTMCELLNHPCCDILAVDKHLNIPLHVACKVGNDRVVARLLRHQPERYLHVQLNALDDSFRTPLHKVCFEYGSAEVMRLLLGYGRDLNINARDKDGNTPLHCICSGFRFNRTDVGRTMLNLLLEHPSINIMEENSKGRTPIDEVLDKIQPSKQKNNHTEMLTELVYRKNQQQRQKFLFYLQQWKMFCFVKLV
jgi:ankyrin repeat protein